MFAALGATLKIWSTKGKRPISIVHDEAKGLTPARIEWLRRNLRNPELIADSRRGTGSELVDVVLVDSREDARVQVADLLAGLGRVAGEQILVGKQHPLFSSLEPAISDFTIWPVYEHMQVGKARETMDHFRQLFIADGSST